MRSAYRLSALLVIGLSAGINIAGRIIEVVSGMPYEQFMQTRLFDPLGMGCTKFVPDAAMLKRLAKAYQYTAGPAVLAEIPVVGLQYPLDDPHRCPSPSGGLFSTASDVGRFLQMLLNEGTFEGRDYLSAAAIRQMTTTPTGSLTSAMRPPEDGYGFGWATTRKDPGNTKAALIGGFGHGGAFNTNMWVDPQRSLAVVYLIQMSGVTTPRLEKARQTFQQAAFAAFGR